MFRPVLAAFAVALSAGCDQNPVEQRATAIRERNARLDEVSRVRVMQEVRKRWLVSGDAWFGKLPDGSVLRLDSPVVTVAPVKAGKSFCCNWLGELSIVANRWQRLPASDFPGPFVMKYRASLESTGRYTLTATAGEEVTPPTAKEIAALK